MIYDVVSVPLQSSKKTLRSWMIEKSSLHEVEGPIVAMSK